jgi:hypothetical protein
MFSSARHNFLKSTLFVSAFAASLSLLACTTSASEDGLSAGGSNGTVSYDGKSWGLVTGICPGTTDYISTFSMMSGDDSRVLYIQTKTTPTAGTYSVTHGANDPDSLGTGEVGVSIYDLDFSFVSGTAGTVTISRPTSSTVLFEGTAVSFDNGKTASFSATATFGCSN